MLRARKTGVLTPCIFFVENDAATIFMERIDGQSVRDVLLSGNLTPAGVSAPALSVSPIKTLSSMLLSFTYPDADLCIFELLGLPVVCRYRCPPSKDWTPTGYFA